MPYQQPSSRVLIPQQSNAQRAPSFTITFGNMPSKLYNDPVDRQSFVLLLFKVQEWRDNGSWALYELQFRLCRTYTLQEGSDEWRKEHADIQQQFHRLFTDIQKTREYTRALQRAYVKHEWDSRLGALNNRLCEAHGQNVLKAKWKHFLATSSESYTKEPPDSATGSKSWIRDKLPRHKFRGELLKSRAYMKNGATGT